jgi:hypothetical protein
MKKIKKNIGAYFQLMRKQKITLKFQRNHFWDLSRDEGFKKTLQRLEKNIIENKKIKENEINKIREFLLSNNGSNNNKIIIYVDYLISLIENNISEYYYIFNELKEYMDERNLNEIIGLLREGKKVEDIIWKLREVDKVGKYSLVPSFPHPDIKILYDGIKIPFNINLSGRQILENLRYWRRYLKSELKNKNKKIRKILWNKRDDELKREILVKLAREIYNKRKSEQKPIYKYLELARETIRESLQKYPEYCEYWFCISLTRKEYKSIEESIKIPLISKSQQNTILNIDNNEFLDDETKMNMIIDYVKKCFKEREGDDWLNEYQKQKDFFIKNDFPNTLRHLLKKYKIIDKT